MSPIRTVVGAALLSLAVLGGAVPGARAGETSPAGDVSYFYEPLAAHGDWVRLEPYGWAWTPTTTGYGWRPYRYGHWACTEDAGWVWSSDEPFGWAVYHYGRWLYVEDLGWVWLPGIVWAPAWVEWRVSDEWTGWAALPPTAGWRIDAGPVDVAVAVSAFAWVFVPTRDLAEADLPAHVVSSLHSPALLRAATESRSLAVTDGRILNRGPDRARVEKLHGAPIPRFGVRPLDHPDAAGAVRIEGDALIVPRPALAARPATRRPPPRRPETAEQVAAWFEERREALRRHIEEERRALEQGPGPDAVAIATVDPDTARRRAEAEEALENERWRLEDLLDRQRRRREPPMTSAKGPTGGGGAAGGMGS